MIGNHDLFRQVLDWIVNFCLVCSFSKFSPNLFETLIFLISGVLHVPSIPRCSFTNLYLYLNYGISKINYATESQAKRRLMNQVFCTNEKRNITKAQFDSETLAWNIVFHFIIKEILRNAISHYIFIKQNQESYVVL